MKKSGKSHKEIRAATISHKNVLGEFIITRKGDFDYKSARHIRDDLHITTERLIREWGNARRPGYGDLAVKSWRTKIKKNWDKIAPNDKKEFIKLFGVQGDITKIHKGHSFASMIGGLADPSNIAPQLGSLNLALKENPRFALDLMEQWGMGGDGTKAFFNSRLAKLDPTNIPDAVWLHLAETDVVDPEQLEILTARLGELKSQGVNIQKAGQEFWETGEDVSLESLNKKLTTVEVPNEELNLAKVADKADDEWNLLRRVGLADNKLINTLMKGGDEAVQAWRKVPAPVRAGIKAAPLTTLGVLFDHLEVQSRQADHDEDPSLINKIDLGMAHTSQVLGGASAIGFVPAELPQAIVSGAQLVSDEFQNTDREEPFSQYGPFPTKDTASDMQQKWEATKQQQRLDEYYDAGGGNAAMVKYGWSIQQTQEQGRKNLNKQFLQTQVN
jgi:hypothetical protein